jgi:flavin-binding protein dodecin
MIHYADKHEGKQNRNYPAVRRSQSGVSAQFGVFVKRTIILKEATMSVVKVIEVMAQSEKSWEEATRIALEEAAKTVKDIKSIYIKEFQAVVENNKITQYRVDTKISFIIHPEIQEEHKKEHAMANV